MTHIFHHYFSFAHPFQSKKLTNDTRERHLKMSQSEVMKIQAAGNGDDANSKQVEKKVQKAVVATAAATPDGELQMKHPLQVLIYYICTVISIIYDYLRLFYHFYGRGV